jgi:Bacterial mobilisation protein (MobC)
MSRSGNGIAEPPPARSAAGVIELPAPRPRRRGGVRRKAVNPANADIHLRVTPARKASLRAEAKQAGVSITNYLLRNTGRATPAPSTAIADPLILTRLLGELGKWGSNLNQLARDHNRTGQDPELDELRRIREAAADMRAALLRALGHAD